MTEKSIHIHVHGAPNPASGVHIPLGWVITGTAIGCLMLGAYTVSHAPTRQAERMPVVLGPEGAGMPPVLSGPKESGTPPHFTTDTTSGVFTPPADDELPRPARHSI